jgi:hypothetical protein
MAVHVERVDWTEFGLRITKSYGWRPGVASLFAASVALAQAPSLTPEDKDAIQQLAPGQWRVKSSTHFVPIR